MHKIQFRSSFNKTLKSYDHERPQIQFFQSLHFFYLKTSLGNFQTRLRKNRTDLWNSYQSLKLKMNLCFFYVTKASKKLVMNKNPSNWWHELTVLFVYLVVIHRYLVLHVISILLPYSGITWSKKKEILLPVGFIKWPNTLKRFPDELLECVWPFCDINVSQYIVLERK